MAENGVPESSFEASNSIFGFNFAMTQGGALNMIDVDANIVSCLFFNNVADGTGTGGTPVSPDGGLESFYIGDDLEIGDTSVNCLYDAMARWTGVRPNLLRSHIQRFRRETRQ